MGLIMLVLPDLPRTVWNLSRGGGAEPGVPPGFEPLIGVAAGAGVGAASEEFLGTGDPQALVGREQHS